MFLWKPEEACPLLFTMIPEISDGDPEVKKSAIQCHTVTKETGFMYRVSYLYSCFETLKKAHSMVNTLQRVHCAYTSRKMERRRETKTVQYV